MRIAILTDRINPIYTGGYEYLFYNIAQRLSEEHEITIFTSMSEEYIYLNKVKYVKIAKKYKYLNKYGIHNFIDSVRYTIRLYNNINKFNEFDIVIMNTIPYFLYGSILKRIIAKKIPIFYEAWHDYLKEKSIFLRYILPREIKKIVINSDFIIAISSQTKKSLIKNYNAKDVKIIPIGIKTETTISIGPKKYDVIYLGRLASIKHVDHLILAVSLIVPQFPNLKLVIAGDGEEFSNLKSLTNELGLVDNVSFLGYVSEEEKYNLLSSCKIFVLPSEREGFSISTLEAMAHGCVPIVSKPKYEEIFGVSDFVLDRETGLYFEQGNSSHLSDKILELLNDEALYKNLQQNGIEMGKKFDWTEIIKMYEKVLNAFLEKN